MDCDSMYLKCTLLLVNLGVEVSGMILVGIGVILKFQFAQVTNLLDLVTIVSDVYIIIGIIIFAVAIIGLFGACCENHTLLTIHWRLNTILVLTQSVLIILTCICVTRERTSNSLRLQAWFNHAYFDKNPAVENQQVFSRLEEMFNCCGPSGPASYKDVHLPESCCIGKVVPPSSCDERFANTNGCNNALGQFFQKYAEISTGVGIFLTVLEGLAAVCAFLCAKTIRNHQGYTRI